MKTAPCLYFILVLLFMLFATECASIAADSRYNDEHPRELIEIVYEQNVNQLRGRVDMAIYGARFTSLCI